MFDAWVCWGCGIGLVTQDTVHRQLNEPTKLNDVLSWTPEAQEARKKLQASSSSHGVSPKGGGTWERDCGARCAGQCGILPPPPRNNTFTTYKTTWFAESAQKQHIYNI